MSNEFIFTNCVQPPSNLLLDRGSRLYLDAVSSVAGETVTVSAVLLLPNGKIQSFPAGTKTVDVNGLIASFVTDALEPYAGFLLSCSLSCSAATVRGQTYARVSVKRQDGSFSYVVKAGYITASKPISYPPIEVEDALSGFGKVTSTNLIDQGNGTWLRNVTANRYWRLISVIIRSVTDATVSNRIWHLNIYNGLRIATIVASNAVSPSSTTFMTFARGLQNVKDGSSNPQAITAPIGDFFLGEAGTIELYTNNFSGGDTFTAPIITFEEFVILP